MAELFNITLFSFLNFNAKIVPVRPYMVSIHMFTNKRINLRYVFSLTCASIISSEYFINIEDSLIFCGNNLMAVSK